ncbi:OsmC family protein [Alicyclobacillus sp. SO9]|uniref:OsmC family protein n=1 Tax=Alicyclobacillus sp. SO9 TaxID=2665646 RepID=UPI00351CA085
MKITANWKGKRHFEASGPSGYKVSMDAKQEAGGEDKGNRPMELVLMGLVGCTGIDISMILERMRQPLQDLQIEAEGTRQDEHPQRFTQIDLYYHITGEVAPEKAWRAIHLSEEKYCSASASLNATIVPHLILNGDEVSSH